MINGTKPKSRIFDAPDDLVLYLPNELITVREARKRLFLQEVANPTVEMRAPNLYSKSNLIRKTHRTRDDTIVIDDDNIPPSELVDA